MVELTNCKKIQKIFLAFTLVFTSLNVASCAHKDVRVVKTGDVIYFDTKNLNWDTVKIYFYSTWGKSEIVKWDVDLGQVFRSMQKNLCKLRIVKKTFL